MSYQLCESFLITCLYPYFIDENRSFFFLREIYSSGSIRRFLLFRRINSLWNQQVLTFLNRLMSTKWVSPFPFPDFLPLFVDPWLEIHYWFNQFRDLFPKTPCSTSRIRNILYVNDNEIQDLLPYARLKKDTHKFPWVVNQLHDIDIVSEWAFLKFGTIITLEDWIEERLRDRILSERKRKKRASSSSWQYNGSK